MNHRGAHTSPFRLKAEATCALATLLALVAGGAAAQSPRAAAPIDLTGYWVSVVSTEWRYRMMTPPKGDYTGIPLTAAARTVADAWDPARDTAAGEQCRAYGAPAIMHVPARLHITWADEATLRVDVDHGTQTRLFRFASPAAAAARTWQGQSLADWQLVRPATGGGPPSAFTRPTSLKVVTTGLRPGYVRANGVPYSQNARLTEYFDLVPGVRGDQWLIVTVHLDDPQYLEQPLLRSVQFRRQADASGWAPTPCVARW
jgi:hypothetical protein